MGRRRKLEEERGAVRSPRFPLPVRATLHLDGARAGLEGRLADLSCGGALVRVAAVLPVGTVLEVRFRIAVQGEDHHITLPAVVARVGPRGTALEFTAVPEDISRLLREFSLHRLFGVR